LKFPKPQESFPRLFKVSQASGKFRELPRKSGARASPPIFPDGRTTLKIFRFFRLWRLRRPAHGPAAPMIQPEFRKGWSL
jgi:hypothetical protein